jgi:hypothetical protein
MSRSNRAFKTTINSWALYITTKREMLKRRGYVLHFSTLLLKLVTKFLEEQNKEELALLSHNCDENTVFRLTVNSLLLLFVLVLVV